MKTNKIYILITFKPNEIELTERKYEKMAKMVKWVVKQNYDPYWTIHTPFGENEYLELTVNNDNNKGKISQKQDGFDEIMETIGKIIDE
ncbi:MAG: hypothetical protein HQ521_18780 [Bacteroidetes bacterium]|nr:hypothetical protein [Bacteroidota bacterium]